MSFSDFFFVKRVNIKQKTTFLAAFTSFCVFVFAGIIILAWPPYKEMIGYEKIVNKWDQIFQSTTNPVISHVNSYTNIQWNGDCNSSVGWDVLLDDSALTGNQLIKYFMWTNHSSCMLSHDFGGVFMENPSGLAGQKAVCIDPKVAPQPGNCLVYSFGIADEWSFDEEMSRYGCDVFAFDPSMGMDHHDHSPGNVHFYNWGLGDGDEGHDNPWNWTIYSLATIYEKLTIRHGPKIIDYLKIDIEYSEWIALPDIIESGMLSNVRQLGMEVHLNSQSSLEQHIIWAKLLRTIEKMGMVRFDCEYNPWSIGTFAHFPVTGSLGYEIAWYNNNLSHVGV